MIGFLLKERYRIVNQIGVGVTSTVFEADDIQTGNRVAIKVLKPELNQNLTFLQRFRRETRTTQSINSPYIVKVYDYDIQDGHNYIVMELVRGKTLRQLLDEKSPLPIIQSLRYTIQILDGATEAHRAGIVHRDLKPANIMVTKDGTVKVMDFGIAKDAAMTSITSDGSVIGTPYYMSPEQVKGLSVDSRSDVYAIGAILYEMLTGTPPFESESTYAIITMHIEKPPTPLNVVNNNIPMLLNAMVLKALAKRPEDRYQNASEMAYALRLYPGITSEASRTVDGPTVPIPHLYMPHYQAQTPTPSQYLPPSQTPPFVQELIGNDHTIQPGMQSLPPTQNYSPTPLPSASNPPYNMPLPPQNAQQNPQSHFIQELIGNDHTIQPGMQSSAQPPIPPAIQAYTPTPPPIQNYNPTLPPNGQAFIPTAPMPLVGYSPTPPPLVDYTPTPPAPIQGYNQTPFPAAQSPMPAGAQSPIPPAIQAYTPTPPPMPRAQGYPISPQNKKKHAVSLWLVIMLGLLALVGAIALVIMLATSNGSTTVAQNTTALPASTVTTSATTVAQSVTTATTSTQTALVATTATASLLPMPDPDATAFNAASAALQAKDWKKAISLLEGLAAHNFRTAEVNDRLKIAYCSYGREQLGVADPSELQVLLDKCLALDPNNADAKEAFERIKNYREGAIFASQSNWAAAIPPFEKVYALDVNFRDTGTLLFNAYRQYLGALTDLSSYNDALLVCDKARQMTNGADYSQIDASCKRVQQLAAPTVPAPTPKRAPTATPRTCFSNFFAYNVGQPGVNNVADLGSSSIMGSVINRNKGALAGATVRVSTGGFSFTTQTDGGGHYRIGGLGKGTWNVVVIAAPGYSICTSLSAAVTVSGEPSFVASADFVESEP
ncbi:protein kinase [Candidatus Chlorohelix sp.]|uniref:protein kinase domain-containing protein n=1 Tax=Candidatus Chlorohelix sp. TaxID=3139201 RepID=UPI00303B7E4B